MKNNNLKSMSANKKILLTFYSISFLLFLYYTFSNFSLSQIITLEFAPILKENIFKITNHNNIIIFLGLIVLAFLWSFFLGFTSPIAVFCGMIYGNYLGTLISIIGLTLGSTFLYIVARYFFSDYLSILFSKKYENIRNRFHNNELIFFILYRILISIPFGISNIVAVTFNVKLSNFILGTGIGIFPSVFIWATIGLGFDRLVIKENEFPNYIMILTSPETKLPLLGFLIFFILLLVIRIFFNYKYKK